MNMNIEMWPDGERSGEKKAFDKELKFKELIGEEIKTEDSHEDMHQEYHSSLDKTSNTQKEYVQGIERKVAKRIVDLRMSMNKIKADLDKNPNQTDLKKELAEKEEEFKNLKTINRQPNKMKGQDNVIRDNVQIELPREERRN